MELELGAAREYEVGELLEMITRSLFGEDNGGVATTREVDGSEGGRGIVVANNAKLKIVGQWNQGQGNAVITTKKTMERLFTVLDGGVLEIRGCTLKNGRHYSGGCISVENGGSLVLKDCTIEQCCAQGRKGQDTMTTAGAGGGQAGLGGAVFAWEAQIDISNTKFTRNSALGGDGGSVFLGTNPVHPSARGGDGGGNDRGKGLGGAERENGCDAVCGCGGGGGGGVPALSIFAPTRGGRGGFPGGGNGGDGGGATAQAYEATFNETASTSFCGGQGGKSSPQTGGCGGGGGALGGAVFCYESKVTIRNCHFEQNTCRPGRGGRHPFGWQVGYDGKTRGGGLFLYLTLESASIHDCTFRSNQAQSESNIFDLHHVREVHLAPFLLFNPFPSLTNSTPKRCLRCVDFFAKSKFARLPCNLLHLIIELYVGWL